MVSYGELKNNIDKVLNNISNVCVRCGRDFDKIHLIGASKTMPIEVIDLLDELNIIKTVGENRVQEMVAKYRPLKNMDWHFIGQLQTNKVKNIIDKVDLIHSVDRLSLAETVDRLSGQQGKISDILIEINMGNEQTKGGVEPEDTEKFINELSAFKNLRIKGLMSVMPLCDNEDDLRVYYKSLSELFNKINKFSGDNLDIQYLSAGMSKDYTIAIEYGANMIRLGTAIFGQRDYGGHNA